MFGLASLRVGWGYGSKKIIRCFKCIKPPFNVNGVAQLAAAESLKDKKFIIDQLNIIYYMQTRLKNF
jgi:histidinol-phosphate aminotransferase